MGVVVVVVGASASFRKVSKGVLKIFGRGRGNQRNGLVS
jgi:hypothetical protein